MSVPYTFATATSSIPLSELDSNFATAITLGGTNLYLGNTTTTVTGLTLTGSTFTGNVTTSNAVITGGSIDGTTVGATTASTGAFTTLSASSTVSGTGFSTYLASPPSIGSTAANTGAFTTLSASSTVSGTGFSTYLASPPAIGGTTAAAGSFTTLSASSTTTLSGGTANGVAYLNGSKVLTTGSALTFDGTNLTVNSSGSQLNSARYSFVTPSSGYAAVFRYTGGTNNPGLYLTTAESGNLVTLSSSSSPESDQFAFGVGLSEKMRLTSTGLGIGTTSPSATLTVSGSIVSNQTSSFGSALDLSVISTSYYLSRFYNTSTNIGSIATNTAGTGIQLSSSADLRLLSSGGSILIDTNGNAGLGVNPSAWNASFKVIEFGAGSVSSISTTELDIPQNAYFGASSWQYKNSNPASYYQQKNGVHAWFTAPSGTAGNAISFTQAMTLDNSGKLVLGGTSTDGIITLGSSTYGTGAIYQSTKNNGGTFYYGIESSAGASIVNGSSAYASLLFTQGATSLQFGTNNNIRATIDSSGNLLVNTTSNNVAGRTSAKLNVAAGSNDTVQLKGVSTSYLNIASWIPINAPGSGNAYHIGFGDGTSSYTERGVISTNGTGTTYGTNSDYRLKENVQPMTGALAKVVALNPVTYKWKENGSDGEGFIAHELAEICPHAVVGEKDGVKEDGSPLYQNIDTSFLVATLTAAIQELKAEFDAYKASHP
jgi:hypothetical protein